MSPVRNAIASLLGPTPLAFCLRAGILLALLGGATLTSTFERWVVGPLVTGNTVATAEILELLGCSIARSGPYIQDLRPGGFGIEVIGECTGIQVLVILISLTLAFPAPWPARLRGLALGALGIAAVNLLRLVTLFLLGSRFPESFHEIHVYAWQGLFIVLVVTYWYGWARRAGRPRTSPPD